MNRENKEKLNLCSRLIKTLGMLSWSMATIQDHRSCLKKKRRQQAQKHFPKNVQQVCLDNKHAIQECCQTPWPQHAQEKNSADRAATANYAIGQCGSTRVV